MAEELEEEKRVKLPASEYSFDEVSLTEEKSPVDLGELITETEPKTYSFASETNRAAYASALTRGSSSLHDVVDTAVAEGSGEGSMVANILDTVKSKNLTDNRESMVETIIDEEIPEDIRRTVADDLTGSNTDFMTTREQLQVETLADPSGQGESKQSEVYRLNTSNLVNEIIEEQNYAQSLITDQLLTVDQGFGKNLADVATFLGVPGVEQLTVNKFFGLFNGATEDGKIPGTSLKIPKEFMEALNPNTEAGNALFLMGSAKQWFIESMRDLPHVEKMGFLRHVSDSIPSLPGITLHDDNKFAEHYLLTQFLDGKYNNFDKVLDNAVSLLDATVLGSLFPPRYIAKGIAAARNLTRIGDVSSVQKAQQLAMLNRMRSGPQPSSVAASLIHTNPDNAKAAHQAVKNDTSDKTAQALYGKSRGDAIIEDTVFDMVPKTRIRIGSGKPRARVSATVAEEPAGTLKVNEEIIDDIFPDRIHNMDEAIEGVQVEGTVARHLDNEGALYMFPTEKAKLTKNLVNNWGSIAGLKLVNEMSQVGDVVNLAQRTSSGIHVKALYKAEDGSSWVRPKDALEQAAFALASKGIKTEDLQVLKKEGTVFVPYSGGVDEIGQYAVKVDHQYPFNARDQLDWDATTTKRNLFDRANISGQNRGGSFTQWFDPASVLDPRLFGGASDAATRSGKLSAVILDLAKPFSDVYTNAKPWVRGKMDDYLKRANWEGKELDYNKMLEDGLSEVEIDGLKAFGKAQDQIYFLNNRALAQDLEAKGFYTLVNQKENTKLFLKPVNDPYGQITNKREGISYYDADKGELGVLRGTKDASAFKESGHQLGKLRSPTYLGQDGNQAMVDFVKTSNKPDSTYFRRVNQDDTVLSYRKGYYKVTYKDPQFIDEVVTNSRGVEIKRKAFATAGSTLQAERLLENARLSRSADVDPEMTTEYVIRRAKEEHSDQIDDMWNLAESEGRIDQRTRGERLVNSTSPTTAIEHTHILDPMESLVRAASKASTEVSFKPFLESAEARWMATHGKKLGIDSYPLRIKDVQGVGNKISKEVADARTEWQYLRTMRVGFQNNLDDAFKAMFTVTADMFGKASKSLPKSVGKVAEKAEKTLEAAAAGQGVSDAVKGAGFFAHIITNPMRQALLNIKGSVQLAAINPTYMASLRFSDDMQILAGRLMGLTSRQTAKSFSRSQEYVDEMYSAYKASGLAESAGAHALQEGAANFRAETGLWRSSNPVKKAVGAVPAGVRAGIKLGTQVFNWSEHVFKQAAWVTYYDKAKKAAGARKLTNTELAEVTTDAVNFTGNYNKAGQLAQQANSLSIFFQFTSAPLKGFFLQSLNRRLSRAERAKLSVFNLLMYGVPVKFTLDYFGEFLPESREAQDLILNGAEGLIVNQALSMAFDDDVSLDYSGGQPNDPTGIFDLIANIATADGVSKILTNTPSTSLFFGQNPRVTNFVRETMRYFGVLEDEGDSPLPKATYNRVIKYGLGIMGGFSNYFKYQFALEHGKVMGSSGQILDSDVSVGEANSLLFGMPSMDVTRARITKNINYHSSKAARDDVKEHWRVMKQMLAVDGVSNTDPEFTRQVLSLMNKGFGSLDPFLAKERKKLLEKDLADGDLTILNGITRAIGYVDEGTAQRMINVYKPEEADKADKVRLFLKELSEIKANYDKKIREDQ